MSQTPEPSPAIRPSLRLSLGLGLLILTLLVLGWWSASRAKKRWPSGRPKPPRFSTPGWRRRRARSTSARRRAPALAIGIVQPNFGLLDRAERLRGGQDYVDVLRRATVTLEQGGVELVVWSETAWPGVVDRGLEREYSPDHPWRMRSPHPRGRLLVGALTHRFGSARVLNSAVLLDANGRVAGMADKVRTVPFAEHLPLARSLPRLAALLRARRPEWPEIAAGDAPGVLVDGDLRLGVAICGEDLSPGHVRALVDRGANLLAVLASDAWLGSRAASRQHLALSVFRAVEARRDLVRATNTGGSVVIEATGRLRGATPSVEPLREPVPTLVAGEARLLELRSCAPLSTPLLPVLCLLGLGLGRLLEQGRFRSRGSPPPVSGR